MAPCREHKRFILRVCCRQAASAHKGRSKALKAQVAVKRESLQLTRQSSAVHAALEQCVPEAPAEHLSGMQLTAKALSPCQVKQLDTTAWNASSPAPLSGRLQQLQWSLCKLLCTNSTKHCPDQRLCVHQCGQHSSCLIPQLRTAGLPATCLCCAKDSRLRSNSRAAPPEQQRGLLCWGLAASSSGTGRCCRALRAGPKAACCLRRGGGDCAGCCSARPATPRALSSWATTVRHQSWQAPCRA